MSARWSSNIYFHLQMENFSSLIGQNAREFDSTMSAFLFWRKLERDRMAID